MAPIKVYTPGAGGVNIDSDPFLAADEELQVGENAYHDPTAGHGGALRKRPGLTKFNLIAAGGAILGGITMAIAGLGGAPQPTGTFGDPTGDDTGGGDGTGSPGGTIDGDAPSQGAGQFTSSTLFSGARLIVLGHGDNTSSSAVRGLGWYVTSKGINDSAITTTVPGPPGVCWAEPETTTFLGVNGRPFVQDSGWLYYAGNHDQSTGTVATIRKTNAATDTLLCTFPVATVTAAFSNDNVSTGTNKQSVMHIHAGSDGNLYVALKDRAGGADVAAKNYGRIFRVNKTSGSYTELPRLSEVTYVTDITRHLPYTVAYFNGSVFWGQFNTDNNEAYTSSATDPGRNNIFATDSSISTSYLDYSNNGNGNMCMAMVPFPASGGTNQVLFVATGITASGGDSPAIAVRTRETVQYGGVAGSWQTSLLIDQAAGGAGSTVAQSDFSTKTGWATSGGSALAAGAHFSSMIEFDGNLYASFSSSGTVARIFKFVPDYSSVWTDGLWTGNGTWSIAYNSITAIEHYNLCVDDGVLYAVSNARRILTTSDGTTWTDKITNIPAGSHSDTLVNFFAGFNQ